MTFTERCRNQETSHLDDDPFFFVFLFLFLFLLFFEMDQIVLGNLPDDKRTQRISRVV